MAGAACLLIDVENFYRAREQGLRASQRAAIGDEYDFSTDLGHLVDFARDLAEGRRLVVRRGYADFNARRHAGDSEARWDYYLRDAAQALMRKGVEPVQVFRFPGMANKNAADMRLAMDAAALANGPADVDVFLLVTGDSDYIPLALELRRTGATVIVIGLKYGRSRILPQFVDRFEYFESWLAAAERRAESGSEFEGARALLSAALDEGAPLDLEAAESLLQRSLDPPLDPERFDVSTLEEVLRENSAELGIALRKSDDGAWWVERAAEGAAAGADGRSGSRHGPKLYRRLLVGQQGTGGGRFSLYVTPEHDWLRITELAWELSCRGDERPPVYKRDLGHEIGRRLEDDDDAWTDPSRTVPAVLFQLFKSGCYVCAADGPELGSADFHWSFPARLAPDLADLAAMRRRSRAYLLHTLHERLVARGFREGIHPPALAELVVGPDPGEEALARVRLHLEQEGVPVYDGEPAAVEGDAEEITEGAAAAAADATSPASGEIVPAPRGSVPTPPAGDRPRTTDDTKSRN